MQQAIDITRFYDTEVLSGLPPDVVRAVVDAAEHRHLQPGETVFRAGEAYKEALFVLYEGEMVLERPGAPAQHIGPGNVLGLSSYLDGSAYGATARARTATELLALPAKRLRELEARHPALFDALNHLIAERIRARSAAPQPVGGALSRPVRTFMKAPLATCDAHISLRQAYRSMQERRVGSLGVLNDEGGLLGILTCAGVSQALALKGASPDDAVLEAACETPHTVTPDTPLWRAEDALHRHGVKYLVVIDDDRPVGVVSQSDILRALVSEQSNLSRRAAESETLDDLAQLYESVYEVARDARETNRLASRAVRVVSDAHLAVQRRCVELTLQELERDGHGNPPRAYALLIMGSGGRREMLLTPDQDNGIILDDEPGALSEAEQAWFARFTDRLTVNLDRVGYILCPGDIMARNPMFQKPLAHWRRQITHMVNHPTQKAARWSNIVFDFDTLYGDDGLTRRLRQHLLTELQRRSLLLEFMVEDDAEGRPPLGLFSRLITGDAGPHKGKIDIKRNGLRIIADAARVYALSAGIGSTNTIERLQNLVRQGTLSNELVNSVLAAYEELLDLLLVHQIGQRERGEPPDKFIRPDTLSDHAQAALRAAMRAVKRFQDQLQGQFGRTPF